MSEDRIEIRDLLIRGILGVHDWERTTRQDILVNVTMFTDIRAAAAADDLEQSVNYKTAAKDIIAHVESSARFTVEALATDIARICLAMRGVRRVRVRVEKPGAVRFARSVGVEIERQADDFA